MFGHDFRITRKVTNHVKEYKCKKCKKQFTTNVNGNIVELTTKSKEINDVLQLVHTKRTKSRASGNQSIENLLVFSH